MQSADTTAIAICPAVVPTGPKYYSSALPVRGSFCPIEQYQRVYGSYIVVLEHQSILTRAIPKYGRMRGLEDTLDVLERTQLRPHMCAYTYGCRYLSSVGIGTWVTSTYTCTYMRAYVPRCGHPVAYVCMCYCRFRTRVHIRVLRVRTPSWTDLS